MISLELDLKFGARIRFLQKKKTTIAENVATIREYVKF